MILTWRIPGLALLARVKALAVAVGPLIRADTGLYLFVYAYTVFGVGFLHLVGADDRAASIYLVRSLVVLGLLLPMMAVLIDVILVLHRFRRRRRLAFRAVFSLRRLAHFVNGICLVLAMAAFEGTFTSIKNGIFVWRGAFLYDRFQADLDAALHFGSDPWRWLFAVAQNGAVRTIVEWNYNVLWFIICFGALFFVATSPKAAAVRQRYVISFMLVWIVLGNILAALFLSAGPAFYGAVTGDTGRFGEQLAFLAESASSPNSAAAYQSYLWTLHAAGQTGFGSGISAFPSVHVGLITLNALFVWEISRKWGLAAFAYVGFILASSVYLAWHYAIDGYAAIAVTLVVYFAMRALVADPVDCRRRRALGAPPTPACPEEPVTAFAAPLPRPDGSVPYAG